MDYKAAVITVSDRCSAGEKVDKSGPAVAQMLEEAGFPVIYRGLVPDERHEISAEFIKCAYELGADLIVSTGGTGFGKRDITPEATRDVISREIPAIPQAMLHYSLGLTPRDAHKGRRRNTRQKPHSQPPRQRGRRKAEFERGARRS